MHRFIALSWDSSSPPACAEALRYTSLLRAVHPDWRVIESATLSVFHDWPETGPWRCWTLPNHLGGVFGQLFERGAPASRTVQSPVIDVSTAKRMVETGGRVLLERFWGTFVAFLVDAPHRIRFALRSVGAGIACYRLQRDPIEVFFSDLNDLASLGIGALEVDWRYIAGFLRNSQVAVADSAFKNVSEVLAGECIRMGLSAVRREMLWSPTFFCANPSLTDPDECREQLRETTQRCVDAWAQAQPAVLLQLSGGLDSAIVLGCLKRSPARARVACFNRYAEQAGEDERPFAREAAQAAGVVLEEWPWDDADVHLEQCLQTTPMAPKPTIAALLPIEVRVREELMARHRADACWTGEGGDHLFYQFATPLIVADYLWQRRSVTGVGAVLRDAARLTRRTFWSLTALAIRAKLTRNGTPLVAGLPHDTSFVSPDACAQGAVVQTDHAWLRSLATLPPGKQLQVRHLIELLHRDAPTVRVSRAPETHPLVSLPLIEFCLALPTWMAVRGGRNRALARAAFADRVPAAIRERESKGRTGPFLMGAVRRRTATIRELLLDGLLDREGLLHRSAVERHLTRGHPLRPGQLFSLLACVAAEVWLRSRNARQRSY